MVNDKGTKMNAADHTQAKLERLGDRIADLKKRGICTHGWLKTWPDETVTCLDCKAVFASFGEAMFSGKSIIGE
jgi:hypothetical protein